MEKYSSNGLLENYDNLSNMVKEYNDKQNDDFSWITKNDQEAIDITESSKSISYGIPNQIIGNYEKAHLFLCLFNPRTRTDTSEISNLKDYIESENSDGGELFESVEEYSNHIQNNSKNVLELELETLKEEKFSPKEFEKIIDNMKDISTQKFEENGVYLKKISQTSQFKKAYVRSSNNVSDRLIFKSDFKKELITVLDSLNKETLEVEDNLGDLLNEEIKRWIGFEKELINPTEDIKAGFENELIRRFKKALESLSPINKMYYFTKYYWPLFVEESGSRTNELDIIDDLYSGKKNFHFEDCKICNLELLPYRSNHANEFEFKEGKKLYDVESAQFVAKLIIDKIKNSNLKSDDLKFIFRSYPAWRGVMKKVIAAEEDIKISDADQELSTRYEKYFYKFPNQSGILSQTNLCPAKISDDEYAKIKALGNIGRK